MRSFTLEKNSNIRDQLLNVYHFVMEAVKHEKISIEVKKWSKSRDQEKKYHAMIGDFAKQIAFNENRGVVVPIKASKKKYPLMVWKALLIEQFAREKEELGEPLNHPGETVLSLDGLRMITIRPSTTKLLSHEASDFIEYLYQQGAEMGVNFSDKALAVYNEYKEAA
jgi:hypothetical protein